MSHVYFVIVVNVLSLINNPTPLLFITFQFLFPIIATLVLPVGKYYCLKQLHVRSAPLVLSSI